MHRSQSSEEDYALTLFNNQKLSFLAVGKSAFVYGIDDERVLKEYHSEDGEIDIERRAFARLGVHPNIVKYLGATSHHSIILQRGRPLRAVIQQADAAGIPVIEKLRWLKDAAEGIRHIHRNGIIHADIGCNNMVLVHGRVKIIDLEGCSIDGEEATSCYEWFSYRSLTREINQKTDLFAYGCAFYEILTGKPPFYDKFLASEDRRILVRQLYAENKFPCVTELCGGNIIHGCWYGTFDSMDDIIYALSSVIAGEFDANSMLSA